jgi:hypothetical protein
MPQLQRLGPGAPAPLRPSGSAADPSASAQSTAAAPARRQYAIGGGILSRGPRDPGGAATRRLTSRVRSLADALSPASSCTEVLSCGHGHSLRNRNHPIAPAMTRAKGAGTLTSISKPSKISTTRALRPGWKAAHRDVHAVLPMPIISADRFPAVAPFGIAETAAFEPPGWRARMNAATVR